MNNGEKLEVQFFSRLLECSYSSSEVFGVEIIFDIHTVASVFPGLMADMII